MEEKQDAFVDDDTIVDDLPTEGEEEPVDLDKQEDGKPKEPSPEEKKAAKMEAKVAKAEKRYEKLVDMLDQKEKELAEKRGGAPLTDDEKRQKEARDYIRKEALEAYQEAERAKNEQSSRDEIQLRDKIDDIIADNPGTTEKELLAVIEEYDVQPETAMKILKRTQVGKKEKPDMPNPQRGSGTLKPDKAEEERLAKLPFSERMASIARDAKKLLKNQ